MGDTSVIRPVACNAEAHVLTCILTVNIYLNEDMHLWKVI